MMKWIVALMLVLPAALAPAALAGRLPRYGGDLRVQLGRLPASLDPVALSGDDGALVASCLYEGLARWGESDLEPGLARQWLRDDEGRRWVFQLRDGVLFHDGSRLDAAAALESLTHLADARTSTYAWMLADLVGWDDFAAGRTQQIEGMMVLDVNQIELRFATAVTDLPARLAVPAAAIARRHGTDWVGTGPFRLLNAAPGELRLAAFKDHHAGRPFLDHVDLVTRPAPDVALYGAAVDMVRTAGTDLLPTGARRVRAPASRLALLVVQPQSPVLGSEAIRQRLAEAFDRSVLVRAALGGDGEAATTLSPHGPRIVTSRPGEPPGDLAARPQHRARIVVPAAEPVLRAAAERLQVHLFGLGMNADLDILPADSLAQVLGTQGYDVAVLGWTPPQPVAGVLENATRARLLVSSLLQPALGAATPEAWDPAKLAAAKDPEATLRRGDLCIPLVFFHDVWQFSDTIQNLVPGSVAMQLGLENAHLDAAAQ